MSNNGGRKNIFLSTPSARRATTWGIPEYLRIRISIHALREEGDHINTLLSMLEAEFLSTPSARRATSSPRSLGGRIWIISIHALREEGDLSAGFRLEGWDIFLSTPSARRATGTGCTTGNADAISIHALREEGDEN